MKKYLQNRKTSEIDCFRCKIKCLKPNSEITRNLKLNKKLFCSRSCSIKYGASIRNSSSYKNNYDISKHCTNRTDKYTPFRYLFRTCKKRNFEFSLTIEDLINQWKIQQGIYIYRGFKMYLRTYSKKKFDNKMLQASVDRIDSNKGYTKENIQFVCMPINYMKSVFTDTQVKEFLFNLKNSDYSEDRTISSHSNVLDALGSP